MPPTGLLPGSAPNRALELIGKHPEMFADSLKVMRAELMSTFAE